MSSNIDFIGELETIIESRRSADSESSYTKKLFDRGTPYTVTMRKAKFGPFPGCAKISRRSKLAPIEIISVRHLQVRTLSVPTPEYVRTRGNLSILTYHGGRKLQ